MIKDLLTWAAPSLIAVLGGTAAAAAMSAGDSGNSIASLSRIELVSIQAPGGFVTSASAARSSDSVCEAVSITHCFASTKSIGVSHQSWFESPIQLAQAATSSGSIVRLSAPPVRDYWVSATRQPGGVVVFDGYAPDEETRTEFADFEGADVNWLKLGSGAPDVYRDGVDVGMRLLSRLSEGRFTLRGNVLTVSGVAASSGDYRALSSGVEEDMPDGIILAMADVKAPAATQYAFAVTRSADGVTTLSGMLPGPDLEHTLLDQLDKDATVSVSYASGEPPNFGSGAQQAINLVSKLAPGKVEFLGGSWTVSGTPASEDDKEAIETEFGVRGLAQSGWQLALNEPTSVDVSPYVFRAEKGLDGTIILTGNVPASATKHFLSVRAGENAVDQTNISPGAPKEFARHLVEAMNVMALMKRGAVSFDGTQWEAEGQGAPSYSATAQAEAVGDSGKVWKIAISEPAQTIAEPEPSATDPAASATADNSEVATTSTSAASTAPSVQPAAAPSPAADEPATSPPAEAATATATPVTSAEPAGFAACQTALQTLSSHNAILFQSGAAVITASAEPELDAFADVLARCPQTDVHVEGHTDADGEEKANLALSVARAEAVVNALIQRGINPSRVYAIGYGESQPVADNDTADGKRRNRRIVISVADPATDQ